MHNSSERIVDEILVLDAQSGRREAFELLVSRWQKRLWGHAYNMTGRPEAAWDITRESWLNIVRGLGRLKDPAKFGSWAYRIVSNKAHDWLRRNGRAASVKAVFAGIQFFKTDNTKGQLMYASIFMVGALGIVLMKIFSWLMIYRHGIKRDIKRLELRVVELSEALKSKSKPGRAITQLP